MTVYAVVGMGGEPRKSETQKGPSVKFKRASFAFRTNSQDHLIEMQIFSCNLLVPDTCIGGAILKVQGGISGQSTDWVELKNQTNELVGRVMVSISRETLEIEGEYTHLVQNTEECMMVGGDQDDPQIDEFSDIDCQVQLPQ